MNWVLGHSSSTMKSKYKYVRYRPNGFVNSCPGQACDMRKAADLPWAGCPSIGPGPFIKKRGVTKRFATEREAALFVDKWFISQGREPVNILKPKPDDEKPVKTWTAAQIREMVDDILGPYDEDDGFMFSEKYLRDSLSKILGIDMHGRTVRVYDDE